MIECVAPNKNKTLKEEEESKNEEEKGHLTDSHKSNVTDSSYLFENLKEETKIKSNTNLDNKKTKETIINKNVAIKENLTKKNNFDETNYTDYSRLESCKIELENELGDYLFSNLYKIIDNTVYFN